MMRRKVRRSLSVCSGTLALLALLAGGSGPAAAQGFPTKPLRIVVGPGSDVIMRAVAQKLTAALGQQVVVEQLPGAGGVIAAQTVARAAPDGHTLLASTSSFAINDVLRSDGTVKLLSNFEPVALIAVGPGLLFANAALGAGTLQQFVSLSKAKPDSFNCASSGIGTPLHLGCEMLRTYGKADVRHVPYAGVGPAIIDLMAGRVHIMFALLSASYIQEPRIKVLAVTSKSRYAPVPDVPTVAEAGLPQLEQFRGWNGVHAAGGDRAAQRRDRQGGRRGRREGQDRVRRPRSSTRLRRQLYSLRQGRHRALDQGRHRYRCQGGVGSRSVYHSSSHGPHGMISGHFFGQQRRLFPSSF